MIALQLVVGLIFLFMGITGLASKIIGAIPNAIKSGILLGAGFSAIMGEFKAGGRAGLYPVTVLVGSIFAYFLLFSRDHLEYIKPVRDRFPEHRKDHLHDSDSHRCLYHRIRRFRFQ